MTLKATSVSASFETQIAQQWSGEDTRQALLTE